jgi:N-acetylneuraminate synthase/N,N'-diacetyllegionaminate synthase
MTVDNAAGVRIGGRAIGPGHPCYVIAEAGVNHNGDLRLARELIVEAKKAGADCVKFQTFSAERVATAAAPKADYQRRSTDPGESQIAMLKRLELAPQDFVELRLCCEREGIAFLSTPYSVEDVDVLVAAGADAFKIPSALIVEPELLRHTARQGRPMLLSTGMATLDEIDEAVAVIRGAGAPPLVLLQCTTDYPSAIEDANLRAIATMRERYGAPVGYSDHTTSPIAALGAVALGAAVVEKHFTLDRAMPGPDHSSSADPEGFAALVRAIRELESALGSGEKRPGARERANMIGMRRSLVARRAIAAGETMTAEMLAWKRPATGIAPRDAARLIGRTAKRAIAADAVLEWGMFE